MSVRARGLRARFRGPKAAYQRRGPGNGYAKISLNSDFTSCSPFSANQFLLLLFASVLKNNRFTKDSIKIVIFHRFFLLFQVFHLILMEQYLRN